MAEALPQINKRLLAEVAKQTFIAPVAQQVAWRASQLSPRSMVQSALAGNSIARAVSDFKFNLDFARDPRFEGYRNAVANQTLSGSANNLDNITGRVSPSNDPGVTPIGMNNGASPEVIGVVKESISQGFVRVVEVLQGVRQDIQNLTRTTEETKQPKEAERSANNNSEESPPLASNDNSVKRVDSASNDNEVERLAPASNDNEINTHLPANDIEPVLDNANDNQVERVETTKPKLYVPANDDEVSNDNQQIEKVITANDNEIDTDLKSINQKLAANENEIEVVATNTGNLLDFFRSQEDQKKFNDAESNITRHDSVANDNVEGGLAEAKSGKGILSGVFKRLEETAVNFFEGVIGSKLKDIAKVVRNVFKGPEKALEEVGKVGEEAGKIGESAAKIIPEVSKAASAVSRIGKLFEEIPVVGEYIAVGLSALDGIVGGVKGFMNTKGDLQQKVVGALDGVVQGVLGGISDLGKMVGNQLLGLEAFVIEHLGFKKIADNIRHNDFGKMWDETIGKAIHDFKPFAFMEKLQATVLNFIDGIFEKFLHIHSPFGHTDNAQKQQNQQREQAKKEQQTQVIRKEEDKKAEVVAATAQQAAGDTTPSANKPADVSPVPSTTNNLGPPNILQQAGSAIGGALAEGQRVLGAALPEALGGNIIGAISSGITQASGDKRVDSELKSGEAVYTDASGKKYTRKGIADLIYTKATKEFGFSDVQAKALMGNASQESGFDPKATNKVDLNGYSSIGLFQINNSPRAMGHGRDIAWLKDPINNINLFMSEAKKDKQFMQAKTIEEATTALVGNVERAKDVGGHRDAQGVYHGGAETAKRLVLAKAVDRGYHGGTEQVHSPNPNGVSTPKANPANVGHPALAHKTALGQQLIQGVHNFMNSNGHVNNFHTVNAPVQNNIHQNHPAPVNRPSTTNPHAADLKKANGPRA